MYKSIKQINKDRLKLITRVIEMQGNGQISLERMEELILKLNK